MLLVDVYNVLHVTGVLPPHLAGVDVHGLAELIDASRYARQKVLLVCDGHGAPLATDAIATARLRGREARVEDFVGVLFAGRGRDADTVIEGFIRRFGGQKAITVVSSDRRIARAAKGAGCRSVRSEEFLGQLALDAERVRAEPRRPGFATDLPLSAAETRAWAEAMGVELGEGETAAEETAGSAEEGGRADAGGHGRERERKKGNRSYGSYRSDRTYEKEPQPAQRTEPRVPPPPSAKRPAAAGGSGGGAEAGEEAWLAEAMRVWPDRIDVGEFDMERWLAGDGDVGRGKYE